MTASLDKDSRILSYGIAYTGLTPTAGHFQLGAPGTDGNVIILFSYVSYLPIVGSVSLIPDQQTALLVGCLYANLHTTTNSNG